jgi:hypothetical protein
MSADDLIAQAEQRGVTFSRRDDGWVITGIRRLSKRQQSELLAAIRSQPSSLDIQRDVAPPPKPAPPTPELERFVRPDGRPITEADVFEALSMTGDVEAYREGRLSKVEAYRRTRNGLHAWARMMAGS